MSQDEIAVMDGGKCIMQLRGVRPFFSNKFDITKHRQYCLLSDFDDKNALDIKKYVKNLCKTKVRDNDTIDEVEDAGVIEAWQLNIEKLNMEPVNQLQNFWTKSPEVERSFECTWERTKNKAPGTANRQTECAGCPQGSS